MRICPRSHILEIFSRKKTIDPDLGRLGHRMGEPPMIQIAIKVPAASLLAWTALCRNLQPAFSRPATPCPCWLLTNFDGSSPRTWALHAGIQPLQPNVCGTLNSEPRALRRHSARLHLRAARTKFPGSRPGSYPASTLGC